jgi:hypothetical protein
VTRVFESWLADAEGDHCLRLLAPGRLLLTVTPSKTELADDLTDEEAREMVRLLAGAIRRYVFRTEAS